MSSPKYKRDPYSGALIMVDNKITEEFLEKKKQETQVCGLEIEIHTLKKQLQEVLKFIQRTEEK